MRLKSPTEDLDVAFTFAADVVSADAVVTPRAGPSVGDQLDAAVVTAGNSVTVTLSGGADGAVFDLLLDCVLSTGPRQVNLPIVVIEPEWTMPDGAVGMLSLAEFLAGFGIQETVTATDPTGAGTIDRPYLVDALIKAQAEVETHVAMRYSLPLDTPPTIIKTAIADLARARLYPRGVPDEAAEAAKQARRLLDKIANGALALPGAAGLPAPEEAASPGVLVRGGDRAYPDDLAGF